MSVAQPTLDFSAAQQAAEDGEALIVDLEGYEGPLHVLLALARTQKVDLLKLSIARLAEQYLAFVHEARRRRFALAADYLVMAAWLAYLKSRLLLPRPQKQEDEPPAEELAAALAFRLSKLDAMRTAVDALQNRPRLGLDVFTRGDPEAVTIHATARLRSDLHELLQAYVGQRRRQNNRRYRPDPPTIYPLDDARAPAEAPARADQLDAAAGGDPADAPGRPQPRILPCVHAFGGAGAGQGRAARGPPAGRVRRPVSARPSG